MRYFGKWGRRNLPPQVKLEEPKMVKPQSDFVEAARCDVARLKLTRRGSDPGEVALFEADLTGLVRKYETKFSGARNAAPHRAAELEEAMSAIRAYVAKQIAKARQAGAVRF